MKSRYLTATLVFAFLITALHVAGYRYPNALHWGFHFTGFLPATNVVILLSIWIAGILFALWFDVRKVFDPIQSFMNERPVAFLSLIGIIFILAAILLRVKVPLLGDSFYIVNHYADVSRGESPLDPRNEPLASFLFYLFMTIQGKPSYQEFLNAFFYGELVLGVIFIVVVYGIVKSLLSPEQPRFMAFVFLLSLPYMQLFFGYIENYSLILTMLALYIACAILVLQEKIPFYMLAFALILCLLSHFLSGLLIFSFLFVAYDCMIRGKKLDVSIGALICFASFVVVMSTVKWDITKILQISPHSHFFSLSTPDNNGWMQSQPYGFFSFYHLTDLLNYAALMTPAIIALFILQMLQKKKYFTGPRRREQAFMVIAFLPVIILMLITVFDLGMARDWDVPAPLFFILAIVTLSMFFEHPFPARDKALSIVLGLSILHSTTMFMLNSTTEASISRYKSLFDKRNMAHYAYYTGALYLAHYYHQVKDITGGIDAWSDYVKAIPSDDRGYRNLLSNFDRLKNPPVKAIVSTYEKWIQAIPGNLSAKKEFINYLTEAGNAYFNEGYLREAQMLYGKALKLNPSMPALYNNLGSVFAEQGKIPEAIAFYQRAIQLDSTYADAFYNMGNAYSDNNEHGKARECLKIAAEMGSEKAQKTIEEHSPPGPVGMVDSRSDTARPRFMD
jgi:tetratricopeptide (TPR) repeat protein